VEVATSVDKIDIPTAWIVFPMTSIARPGTKNAGPSTGNAARTSIPRAQAQGSGAQAQGSRAEAQGSEAAAQASGAAAQGSRAKARRHGDRRQGTPDAGQRTPDGGELPRARTSRDKPVMRQRHPGAHPDASAAETPPHKQPPLAPHSWVVPPNRALWITAGLEHEVKMSGMIKIRTVFIDATAVRNVPERSCVMTVSPLLRKLIVSAVQIPPDYAEDSRGDRLMRLRWIRCASRMCSRCTCPCPLTHDSGHRCRIRLRLREPKCVHGHVQAAFRENAVHVLSMSRESTRERVDINACRVK